MPLDKTCTLMPSGVGSMIIVFLIFAISAFVSAFVYIFYKAINFAVFTAF